MEDWFWSGAAHIFHFLGTTAFVPVVLALTFLYSLALTAVSTIRRRWVTALMAVAILLVLAIAALILATQDLPEGGRGLGLSPDSKLAGHVAAIFLLVLAGLALSVHRPRVVVSCLLAAGALVCLVNLTNVGMTVAGATPMQRVMMFGDVGDGRTRHYLGDDLLYCYPPQNAIIRVPYGYITDKTSIPPAAKPFVAIIGALSGGNDGEDTEGAVIHDWLYALGGSEADRAIADDLLRFAMDEETVGSATRWVIHRSVRFGGKSSFGRETEWRFADPATGRLIEDPKRLPVRAGEKPFMLRVRDCEAIAEKPEIAVCAYRRLHSIRSQRPIWPIGSIRPGPELSYVGPLETSSVTDQDCDAIAKEHFLP